MKDWKPITKRTTVEIYFPEEYEYRKQIGEDITSIDDLIDVSKELKEAVRNDKEIFFYRKRLGLTKGEIMHLIFNKLTDKRKVDVLFEALDYMESYNGRSQSECIALALGYVEDSETELWVKEN